MPGVSGILETALYVGDPARSADFYRNLFGFDTLLESERLIALAVGDRSVLLLFHRGTTSEPFEVGGGTIPGHEGSGRTHFAFAMGAEEFEPWVRHLESRGIRIESTVTWPSDAKSIYFRDPDENLVELITPGFWSNY